MESHSGELSVHERIHTDVKHYTCVTCGNVPGTLLIMK